MPPAFAAGLSLRSLRPWSVCLVIRSTGTGTSIRFLLIRKRHAVLVDRLVQWPALVHLGDLLFHVRRIHFAHKLVRMGHLMAHGKHLRVVRGDEHIRHGLHLLVRLIHVVDAERLVHVVHGVLDGRDHRREAGALRARQAPLVEWSMYATTHDGEYWSSGCACMLLCRRCSGSCVCSCCLVGLVAGGSDLVCGAAACRCFVSERV